jgi:DNA replication protein DnaC
LADLLQAEADSRHQRYVPARVPMAPWPFRKTLETFDFGVQPRIDERPMRTLAHLPWVDAAAHRIWLGPPGVGKTHLLVALALPAIQAPSSVYLVTVPDLVADLRKAWDENRFAKRLAVYPRPKLLGVDEGLSADGPAGGDALLPLGGRPLRNREHGPHGPHGL